MQAVGKVLTQQHAPVGLVSDGIHVRRDLMALLAPVQLNHFLSVDGVESVRVHHHTEQPRIRLQGSECKSQSG